MATTRARKPKASTAVPPVGDASASASAEVGDVDSSKMAKAHLVTPTDLPTDSPISSAAPRGHGRQIRARIGTRAGAEVAVQLPAEVHDMEVLDPVEGPVAEVFVGRAVTPEEALRNARGQKEVSAALARIDASRKRRMGVALAVDPQGGQLPLWDERLRGLPNSLARGALFTCRSKTAPREILRNELLATTSGVAVSFTGQELRQDDQDVWLQIAHLVRSHPLGNQVELSAYQLLKALGWSDSSRDYLRLRTCFERLTEATIKVNFDNGRHGFAGHLLEKIQWADAGSGKRERWRIRLDPEILELFGPSDYSLLDWRQRLQLRTLAKWLHSFYSTHRAPVGYSVALLYKLSGSSNSRMSGFRRDLISGLEELVRVGFLLHYRLEVASDVILVRRNITKPQIGMTEAIAAG